MFKQEITEKEMDEQITIESIKSIFSGNNNDTSQTSKNNLSDDENESRCCSRCRGKKKNEANPLELGAGHGTVWLEGRGTGEDS